jgi:hypothetical protein
MVVGLPILIVLIWPNLVSGPRGDGHRGQCRSDLKQIALALLNYEHANGCFPPACIVGLDGKPWHSWRVLVLPFMDYPGLYKEYDFNEPWDGPKNRRLGDQMPHYYRCPSAPYSDGKASRMTNYVAVTGPGTAWPGSKSTQIGDIRDGTDKTIRVVEIADSDIPWMEPRDLTLEEVVATSAPGEAAEKNRLADSHFLEEPPGVRGAWVVMADDSTHFLPAGFPKDQLKALATINGGEHVDLPDPAPRSAWQRLSWLNRVGLALFAVSFVALAWQTFRRPRGATLVRLTPNPNPQDPPV